MNSIDIKFIRDFEKIYKVDFIETNFIDGSIEKLNKDHEVISVIEIPNKYYSIVLSERELDKYKDFGGGYKSIEFIGYRPLERTECKEDE